MRWFSLGSKALNRARREKVSGGVCDLKQGGNTFTAWPDDSLLQARGSAMRESRARFGTGRRRASGPRVLVRASRGRAPASRRQANRDPRFPPFRRPPGGSASREHYRATFVQSSACAARPSTWRGSLRRFAIAPSSLALAATGAAGLEPATPGFGDRNYSAQLQAARGTCPTSCPIHPTLFRVWFRDSCDLARVGR